MQLTNIASGIQRAITSLSVTPQLRIKVLKLAIMTLSGFPSQVWEPIAVAYAKPSASTSDAIHFYGNAPTATKTGGEYIAFRLRGQQAEGLVYVQNSDQGSCFRGIYNPRTQQINQLTYAYQEMGSNHWQLHREAKPLSVKDFTHRLDSRSMSPGANRWMQECFVYFQSH